MTGYSAPIADIKFVTEKLLDMPAHYEQYPAYENATSDMLDMVYTECAKFCEAELAPINQSGDQEGCRWNDGVVSTPKGFKEAYQAFVDGGWQGISHPVEYGGQGLPPSVGLICTEMT